METIETMNDVALRRRVRYRKAGTEEKPFVTFVRAPVVSTKAALNNEATPAIALAYLSAYIRNKGYSFAIVDGIAEGLDVIWDLEDRPGYLCKGLRLEEIVERIPSDTDVIAFAAMFSGDWPVLRKLLGMIRERFPEALLVAGGEHITALSEYSLRDCEALDICVRGEGEHKLYEVLETFGEDGDFARVNGIAFLDADGGYHEIGGLERIREVDEIPWPIWPEGYMEKFWEAGKSYGVQTERDMPIMASRGCPYQCTFCSNSRMWTTRYILRDPDDLIAEIKSYIDRYDITSMQFYDLTAITKKRWTVEFCNKLIENDIKINWSLPSGTRSEALDEETLGLLKKTGCNYLVYAPESGSPETLEKIKKRVDLKRLNASIMEAKRQGIVVRTNLIIGFPCETRRNVFQTFFYGLMLAIKGVDEASTYIFSPYPGTEIFEEVASEGRLELNDDYFYALTSLNGDYTKLNLISVHPYISAGELGFYRTLSLILNYGMSYLVYPWRIIRTIRNLRSDHAAATVLEHRLKDKLLRRGLKKKMAAEAAS